MKKKKMTKRTIDSNHCPYLDSINRSLLDFDFEKTCSVSLSNLNVYACLVCGKYFRGIPILNYINCFKLHHSLYLINKYIKIKTNN